MWKNVLSIPYFFLSLIYSNYTTDKHLPDRQSIESNITLRIIAGSDANEGQFPYLVSLRYLYNYHFCGGSILTDKWILTAAHCVHDKDPYALEVFAGSSDLRKHSNGVYHRIQRIIIHPKYIGRTNHFANDIALMQVISSFKFNDNVTCANIQPRYPKTLCQVAGWGRIQYEGSGTFKLLYVNLQLLSPGWCQIVIFSGYPYKLCTVPLENTRGGTCQGDSGSGIMCNGLLSGIVSYGKRGCHGSKYAPGVSTNVAYYLPWIEEHVYLDGKCPIHASSASMKSTDSPDIMYILGFVVSLLVLLLLLTALSFHPLKEFFPNLFHSHESHI